MACSVLPARRISHGRDWLADKINMAKQFLVLGFIGMALFGDRLGERNGCYVSGRCPRMQQRNR